MSTENTVFPADPVDGQVHEQGERRWRYHADRNTWFNVPGPNSNATVNDVGFDYDAQALSWRLDVGTMESV